MFERLVTHSGLFHADDVFAAATLRKLAPMASLLRTRDPEVLAEATQDVRSAVFDVGDQFDVQAHNFDHHQRGFQRERQDSSVPYAAFGLVWESFGMAYCEAALCQDEALDEDTLREVHQRVEFQLVLAIDATDCGKITQHAHLKGDPDARIPLTSLSRVIALYNPTGRQDPHVYDAAFERALDLAATLLQTQAEAALAYVQARHVVEHADDNSPILLLETYVPWHAHAQEHHLFVISPALDGSGWMVETVQEDFVPFCPFPQAWGGLRGEELAAVCGVEDVIFCHRARFIAAARSREGALKLAQLALAHSSSE